MNHDTTSTPLDRRQLFRIGGITVGAAALLAACAENEYTGQLGRVGNGPETPALQDAVVDDSVLLRAAASIVTVNDAATWLCQIVMFLVLGLLVTPTSLLAVIVPAAVLATASSASSRKVRHSSERGTSGPAEMRTLLDAIRRHDPDAAQAAAQAHVRHAAEIALKNLAKEQD